MRSSLEGVVSSHIYSWKKIKFRSKKSSIGVKPEPDSAEPQTKENVQLIERKSRVPQMHGGIGDAVVVYREPFPTPQIWYHRLSHR